LVAIHELQRASGEAPVLGIIGDVQVTGEHPLTIRARVPYEVVGHGAEL
jgi:hypothetical protein